PVYLENQLTPGTVEFAMHIRVQRYVNLSPLESRYQNDQAGCPAYAPKVLLKIGLCAYARGLIALRKIEQACRANITFMALACGRVPDHSTIARFVSSMQDAMVSLWGDILLVCEEQGLLGGPHFAVDGLKLASKAAQAWRGTFADLRQTQEKWAAKVKPLLAEQTRADQEGAPASAAEQSSEQEKVQAQMQR